MEATTPQGLAYGEDYYAGKSSNYLLGYRPLKYRLFWERRIAALKRHVAGGRVLDVGCAYGFFIRHLAPQFDCYGMDVSSHAIEEAERIVRSGSVRVGDVSVEIPFDLEFDAITAFDVIEHVSDYGKAMRNIAEKLKAGGILYMELPVKRAAIDNDQSHHYRPLKDYTDFLVAEGFTILESSTYFTIGSRILLIPSKDGHNYAQVIARFSGKRNG